MGVTEPAPAWRQPPGHGRRRARRIARTLAPAAWALGGFASAEARVEMGLGVTLRPDVLVAVGDPPPDGVLRAPPLLVVLLDGPETVAAWLASGATAVWAVDHGAVRRWLADGTVTDVAPDGWLDVPGRPGLRLAASELSPSADPRLDRGAGAREAGALRRGKILR